MEAPEEDEREPFLDPRARSSGWATCWPSTRLLGPESPPVPGSCGSLAPGVDALAPAGRVDHQCPLLQPTVVTARSGQPLLRESPWAICPMRHSPCPKNSCPARSRDASPGVSTGTEQTAVSPQGLHLNPGGEKDSSLGACPQP